ncbi:MAG: outer membrane lipoprotein-sorting protein [Spirochaetaceae bacterium]|nr:MAG: outer membrane lipoprotein-sorting protein [Spirochaetaceae bacterium]
MKYTAQIRNCFRRSRFGRQARILQSALIGALLLSPVVSLAAISPSEIMERVEEQRRSESSRSRMTMLVYPDANSERDVREFNIITYGRGQDDSYMEFVSPRSIQGLRVLDLDGATRVYFPSTGRVRNITGRSRSGSVGGVGGDFSYEDMGGGSLLETYGEFQLKEEQGDVYVVSAVPTDPDSSYSRVILYVDKDTYTTSRVEYFENGSEPSKVLTTSRVRVVSGRNVPTEMVMENLERRSRTVIRIHDIAFDGPVDARLFHPNRFYR